MLVTDKKQLRDSRLSSSNPLQLQLAKRSGLKKKKMLHRILLKIQTQYEITGNQKLQEKQAIVNDSHRSIVKKPVQNKVRRLLFKGKIEWNEHIKNKN